MTATLSIVPHIIKLWSLSRLRIPEPNRAHQFDLSIRKLYHDITSNMPPSDTTPLLPQSSREQAPAPQGDSHPITLRACHSPWRGINQKLLFSIRSILTSYLTSVAGVGLKYKLESEDDHDGWRIPFQFSTVAFCFLWAYHLLTLTWTGVHTFQRSNQESDDEPQDSSAQARVARFFSPPQQASSAQRIGFSLFYTVSHVFTFLNTLIYWAVLVPAGHGGFKPPEFPNHRHNPGNSTAIFYDPSDSNTGVDKGLFEEDDIKAFSILNIWSFTAIIALIEILFLNSIRRQSPAVGHIGGTVVASGLYLAWAGIGKLTTGHWGLFFLDPELLGDSTGAAVAAAAGFVAASAGIFIWIYGLIAMREAITASR
ncbi:hypothetical protein F5Y12DRAFT_719462 [Xylaria sp. FL1777]|nr:hypothetical protein F5Y12DRAFT_719462 [Xylaria sp. FL1777]